MKTTFKQRLEKIKNKVNKTKEKQIGGVRLNEQTYSKIDEISREFGISKQELIRKILEDFLIED